ncbi:uncharacterized protein LOC122633158 [Vespula pensylvanica]|uniref:Transcription factor IIIC 90kDa subunit N-terminal domain-containing protein n=1 Tax=Vespula pensylvanica TaxID=30213 RepID=A0A834UH15_VESPE|nr:uncharacterized protein LOC122633158 [Vespula pensylvanica]KAF7438768.1 hypothetical protein H0235_001159 [Vespula pensylvanica]
MILLEEVYNITFSPLVTTLFAVQWTSNNCICVITERGIHVFELIPSPMSPQPNIKFSRSFIYASDILPAYAFINEVTSLTWNTKRREVYSLLMEAALAPKISDATNILPKIIHASWSPENLIHPSKCMLAIITSVGAVELLYQELRNWFSICDISSIWLKTLEDNIKSDFDNCKNEELRFTKIQENLRQLQACAMTWSELFKLEDTYYAYFVTAFRSSDIVIWKIHKVSDSTKNMKPIITSRINLNMNTKINVLLWCTLKPNTYLIIIGCCNGQIQGVLYSNNNNCLENMSIEKYYTYPDRVSVNSLLMVSQNENGIQFIACKGFFLLLFGLTIKGKLMYTHYLQIEGFTISGISVIASERILITTQNGMIYAFDTRENNLKSISIKHKLPQTRVQYLGLACSPNRTMLVCVTSPNSTYDHLITREPSVLYILSLDGEEWEPINIIKNYKHINSNFPWDCLELIRLKAAKVSDPMIILPKVPQNLESLKLYELRISMWLSLITEVLTKKKMIQRIENIGEIAEAQPLIFIHCVCAYLDRLTNKTHLSNDQELSASLLRMCLEIYLAGEDTEEETVTTQYAREALNKTSHFKLKVESCNLCGQIISDLSWNTTKCPSGHKLPRCALTLLQITTVQYRSCPICGQLYHLCLDEEYEEVRCLFCNIPVLYDSRVVDIQNSELYARNLSKPQVSLVELTQNQDSEMSENFSYTEEHQTETPSYSVIVNYDKDESCNITETWREF